MLPKWKPQSHHDVLPWKSAMQANNPPAVTAARSQGRALRRKKRAAAARAAPARRLIYQLDRFCRRRQGQYTMATMKMNAPVIHVDRERKIVFHRESDGWDCGGISTESSQGT